MLMNQKFDLVVMNPKEINTFVARVNFANVIPKKYMGEKMWCISSASAVLQSILNIPIQRFFTFFLFLSFLVFTYLQITATTTTQQHYFSKNSHRVIRILLLYKSNMP